MNGRDRASVRDFAPCMGWEECPPCRAANESPDGRWVFCSRFGLFLDGELARKNPCDYYTRNGARNEGKRR